MKQLKFFIFFLLIVVLPAKAQVMQLKSMQNSMYSMQEQAQIYKPTKAIIGSSVDFLIKGVPNNYVSLYTSLQHSGAEPFRGQSLRIGDFLTKNDTKFSENGIAKINVQIPDNKELIDRELYFEAVTWGKDDYSDLSRVEILGADAREFLSNGILILPKPKDVSMPGFGPSISGFSPDIMRAMDNLGKIKRGDVSPEAELDVEQTYNKRTPAVLRNLQSPDVQKGENE